MNKQVTITQGYHVVLEAGRDWQSEVCEVNTRG